MRRIFSLHTILVITYKGIHLLAEIDEKLRMDKHLFALNEQERWFN